MQKIKVAILYGGISAEHDVSVLSGQSVLDNIDHKLFESIPLEISRQGKFDEIKLKSADIVFICLHGIGGEDGTIQKYLEEIKMPYVGSGVEASALALDKIASKKLWRKQNLPIPSFFHFSKKKWQENKENILKKFKLPVFVKPFNTGSSLGISKVIEKSEILSAIESVFEISDQIIVEEAIENMREIEVAVLGNQDLIISDPGEVIPQKTFYDFEAKYKGKSELIIPAKISLSKEKEIKLLAQKAYLALGCRGFARVDLFMKKPEGKIYLNEINTIPGFTPYSMFPKLLQNYGIEYKDLITKIIKLGLSNAAN